jgi:hypothetical protein
MENMGMKEFNNIPGPMDVKKESSSTFQQMIPMASEGPKRSQLITVKKSLEIDLNFWFA